MSIFDNILGAESQVQSPADFWKWFQKNEKTFFHVIKKGENIEIDFFNPVSSKLDELYDGIYFLVGMYDENTAEFILTPDGVIANIAIVEKLVESAPEIKRWRFTALKPELEIENVNINIDNYGFSSDTLSFYAHEYPEYPDEIDIVVVHRDFKEEDISTIVNGTYIFLDNFLGELNSVTTIDNLRVIGSSEAEDELIPIKKLKHYLVWRQKEFIEKYEETKYSTENDLFSSFEALLENGKPLIAVINTTLLKWDNKSSHPWFLNIKMEYDGEDNNGLPNQEDYDLMNNIEDEIIEKLSDFDGYLNIGRETADNLRYIYIACKEFRKPSLVLHEIAGKYQEMIPVTFSIYKDKYWQTMNRYRM